MQVNYFPSLQVELTPEGADAALEPPYVNINPGGAYHTLSRIWQGIPGIEVVSNGRLWATWYSGGRGEKPQNYVILVTSGDGGKTWTEPVVVVDPPGNVRAFDPALWVDPDGRLWWFWAQSAGERFFDGRDGVWAIWTDNPQDERPVWSEPRRLAHGVMLNKPIVLSTGEWMMPAAVWSNLPPIAHDLPEERYSNVLVSTDRGAIWQVRGRADVHDRGFDEHMLIERRDGSLWMLVRCVRGIGEAVSTDGGRTWEAGRELVFRGPNSRFHVRRLQSGRLLMVYHFDREGRTDLSARLSDDDGKTWFGDLNFDPGMKTSYPDACQTSSGAILMIRDHQRHGAREILLASFTEEDVLRNRFYSRGSWPWILVNKIPE